MRSPIICCILAATGCTAETEAGGPSAVDRASQIGFVLQAVVAGAFPDSPFVSVAAAVVVPDGGFLVADDRGQAVHHFDDRGVHIRTFGRRGAGPGEFNWAPRIGLLGDTLVSIDLGHSRVTYFRLADGVVLATRPFQRSGRYPEPYQYLASGEVIGRLIDPWTCGVYGDETPPPCPWARLGTDSVPDTLLMTPIADGARINIGGNGQIFDYQPLNDSPAIILEKRGLAWATLHRTAIRDGLPGFSLNVVPGARPSFTRFVSAATPAPSASLLDSLVHGARAVFSPGVLRWPDLDERVRRGLRVPDRIPPGSDALLTPDLGAWVQLNRVWRGANDWLRLDPDGTIPGYVRLPEDLRPVDAAGDRLVALRFSEFGEAEVVLIRAAPWR